MPLNNRIFIPGVTPTAPLIFSRKLELDLVPWTAVSHKPRLLTVGEFPQEYLDLRETGFQPAKKAAASRPTSAKSGKKGKKGKK